MCEDLPQRSNRNALTHLSEQYDVGAVELLLAEPVVVHHAHQLLLR